METTLCPKCKDHLTNNLNMKVSKRQKLDSDYSGGNKAGNVPK
jgi:hypothetical protein